MDGQVETEREIAGEVRLSTRLEAVDIDRRLERDRVADGEYGEYGRRQRDRA